MSEFPVLARSSHFTVCRSRLPATCSTLEEIDMVLTENTAGRNDRTQTEPVPAPGPTERDSRR